MISPTKIFPNIHATLLKESFPNLEAFEFHKKLPGYNISPLIDAPIIANTLRVGKVWIKDESSRFGLPAFKILGASWAVYKVLLNQIGENIEPWETLEDLKLRFEHLKPLTLVAATDGNYGRAVAHMAKLLGFQAHIFVPKDIAEARINAIKAEGAEVIIVDGGYDEALAQSGRMASDKQLVISDTAWEGYTEIPRWVMEGYMTIFQELDEQLEEKGDTRVDLVSVQIGVGGLATAAVWHYRRPELSYKPKIVGVESVVADCVLESVKAGHMVKVTDTHPSIMAGLNCGTPSLVAWPIISKGIDIFVAIEDDYARKAMRELDKAGVVSGETGASGLAGLLALLTETDSEKYRKLLNLTQESHIVIISTEGATNPESYEKIVDHPVALEVSLERFVS